MKLIKMLIPLFSLSTSVVPIVLSGCSNNNAIELIEHPNYSGVISKNRINIEANKKYIFEVEASKIDHQKENFYMGCFKTFEYTTLNLIKIKTFNIYYDNVLIDSTVAKLDSSKTLLGFKNDYVVQKIKFEIEYESSVKDCLVQVYNF